MSAIAIQYRKKRASKLALLVGLALLMLISLIWDLSTGPGNFTFSQVASCLIECESAQLDVVIWQLRMPMALMAILVGAMLGCAGAQMQTILNNSLADPFTLGISAAASFGAALAFVMDWSLLPHAGIYLVAGNAFVFSMLSCLVLFAVSRMRGVGSETLILAGIALMFTFNSLLAFLQYVASEDALQQLIFWSLGSLSRASWDKLAICAVVMVAMLMLLLGKTWQLTALRFGDEQARSMGVNAERLRLQVLLIAAMMASVAVAFVGTIGFVGLVAPHISRMLVGENQSYYLPGALISGALLLSLASMLSKVVIPGTLLPIGITTSLIGIPCFFALIFIVRRRSI